MTTFQSHKVLVATILFLSTIYHPWPARGSDLSFSGYLKNFFVVYGTAGLDRGTFTSLPDQEYWGSVNQRIRLRAFYQPASWFSTEAAYDLSFRVQDSLLYSNVFLFGMANPLGYRYADLDRMLYPRSGRNPATLGVLQNLDRLLVTVRTSFFDLYLGRQAIAWGSARGVNPTDIIAPFTFDDLDKEERLGVDAVRIRFPVGRMGEFDAGYVMGKDLEWGNSAAFSRFKFYQWQTDISIMIMGFRENLLLGLDVARAIGGAGSWLELAWVIPDQFAAEDNPVVQGNYLRGSAGLDYSLSSESYAFIEYHYNGAGETSLENYLTNYRKIAYQEGSVYLLSRQYLAPGLVYQITPLVTGAVQSLVNILDPSFYLALDVEYNISQNIYLSGGMFLGLGKSPEGIRYQSEFGGYPDTYYTSFRIYF